VWGFGAVALPCFLMPGDVDIIPARRTLLAEMAGFWWLRLDLQFFRRRAPDSLAHRLRGASVVGAMLSDVAASR